MEEVFDAALIAYESKPLIDEKTSNSPGRHSRVLPMRENLSEISGAPRPLYERTHEANGGTAAPTRADVSSATIGTAVIEVKELPRCYPQDLDASAGLVGCRPSF